MSEVPWRCGRVSTGWQTGVIIPYPKGYGKQCNVYRGISILSLPGKESALRNNMNQSRKTANAVFLLDVALQNTLSLSYKFLRNLGSIPLSSIAVVRCRRLPVTGRQITAFLLRSLCSCRRSSGVQRSRG